MDISEIGLNLIKSFEGCVLTAYHLPGEAYYTIGWGHYGPDVYAGMTITQEQADSIFKQDLAKYINVVATAPLGFTPNQNQFDALCSFCYNLGQYIMADFTGLSAERVASEMLLYVHDSTGAVSPGLVRRRREEVNLFNSASTGVSNNTSSEDEVISSQYPESGIAYPNITLNIRNKPSSTTGSILDQYHNGESVIYDSVVITNKYVWISWLPANGGYRVYMAVRDISTGEIFANCEDIPESIDTESIQSKYEEDGIAYPNTTLNIRTQPNATTGTVLDQYTNGESVIYDYVIITNKYVWISWIGGSGNRVYMAIKDISTGERFAECKDVPGSNNGSDETIQNSYSENGTAYPNFTLNIRNKPSSITGSILDQYHNGESVIYDSVIITDKHVWISWIGGSGNRVYMAVKDILTGEKLAECV